METKKEKPKIIIILGPTASGKSDLAVQIALRLGSKQAKKYGLKGAEIISADSRQVYKGMDIGSGKVPKDKSKMTLRGVAKSDSKNQKSKLKNRYFYKGIEHYLLDVASPKRTFTVAQYQKLAKKAIEKILKKGKVPIICGGTGFYIDAIVDNFVFPEIKPSLSLRRKLEKLTTEKLFQKLKNLDPNRAKNIDKNNRRRLIRALEIVMVSKKPVPPIQKQRNYEVLKIGLKKEPKELKKLIEKRLLQRLKQGMIEEVRKLHKKGVGWQQLFNFGLEYRWISLYLRKKITKEEMIEKLKKEIRRYAKRQMTWFKRDKEIHWVSNQRQAEKLVNKNFKAPSSR